MRWGLGRGRKFATSLRASRSDMPPLCTSGVLSKQLSPTPSRLSPLRLGNSIQSLISIRLFQMGCAIILISITGVFPVASPVFGLA